MSNLSLTTQTHGLSSAERRALHRRGRTRLLAARSVAQECGCGAQCGVPLMRGAPMLANYDTEAAEPMTGHLRERVALTLIQHVDSFEVRLLSCAGLRSTGWMV